MGKYDKEIARSKEHIALAQQDLRDAENGFTYFINGEDKAPEIKKRAEDNIDLHTRIISGYEKKDA